MLHELGHSALEQIDQLKKRVRPERVVEAEAVSFICLTHLLGDEITAEEAGKYSFGYITSWDIKDMDGFKKCLSHIQKTAYELITKIDAEIEVICQNKSK